MVTSGNTELPETIKTKLRPIRVFRERSDLTTTNLVDLEYHLDPSKPFDVLPATQAFEETTSIEVMDPRILAVKQTGEDGEPQVIILSPAQLVLLTQRCGLMLVQATGNHEWTDGRDRLT